MFDYSFLNKCSFFGVYMCECMYGACACMVGLGEAFRAQLWTQIVLQGRRVRSNSDGWEGILKEQNQKRLNMLSFL